MSRSVTQSTSSDTEAVIPSTATTSRTTHAATALSPSSSSSVSPTPCPISPATASVSCFGDIDVVDLEVEAAPPQDPDFDAQLVEMIKCHADNDAPGLELAFLTDTLDQHPTPDDIQPPHLTIGPQGERKLSKAEHRRYRNRLSSARSRARRLLLKHQKETQVLELRANIRFLEARFRQLTYLADIPVSTLFEFVARVSMRDPPHRSES